MKMINGLFLIAVWVIGAGCVSSSQTNSGNFPADCQSEKQNIVFIEKCEVVKLGWRGANGSDFIIGQ